MRNAPLPPTTFGIQLEDFSNLGHLDIQPENTTWIGGIQISWSAVEPVTGTREWATLHLQETRMITLASKGIVAIANVRSVPSWAQARPGVSCGPIAPEHYDEFALFMHDLVARYSQFPYNVHVWEIWNEPDAPYTKVLPDSPFGCWGDPAAPYYGGQAFGEMLKVTYPAIKAADPNAIVLIGGLLLDCDPNNPPPGKDCAMSNFLEGVLQAGAGNAFDGVSFHAYDYYMAPGEYSNPNWHSSWQSVPGQNIGPVLTAKAQFIQSILDQYGLADKLLFNTESALLCDSCSPPAPEFEQTKAVYLAHAYILAQAIGLKGNLWYTEKGWRHSGLLDNNNHPNSAFGAYLTAAAEIGRASFVGNVSGYPGSVIGYRFRSAQQELWAIWNAGQTTVSITLPSMPAKILDVQGNPITTTTSLTLTISPLYIEWDNSVTP